MRRSLFLSIVLLGTMLTAVAQTDWTTYHGSYTGNRYTTINQITRDNVARMTQVWSATLQGANRPQTTPLVVEGVMYATNTNECWALDAATGKEVWHYKRPRTPGAVGNAVGGVNRGVGFAGDLVYMVTDNAHLIALNRKTGDLVWETEMADIRENYGATGAPLTLGTLVISGVTGGEHGARGFVAAFDQKSGKEAWRFWTVPARGEPGSETWKGKAIDHPGSPTWYTGTYDPQLDLIYWPVGNPSPEYDGSERIGDNLYSDSIVALDAKTGKLKWHYQFTPHDLHDWDAAEPPVLVDTNWPNAAGPARKLLIQANRNGFFYVLDRTDGKLLLGKPFVKKINWAKEIGVDGRPVLEKLTPNPDGTITVCPGLVGGSNWFSSSYDPRTSIYYVQTLESCNLFAPVVPAEWESGKQYLGGPQARGVPGETNQKILRALDIRTGNPVWEVPQTGRGGTWGGTLLTSTGVLFFCDDNGSLSAVNAADGKPLWSQQLNEAWHASPITYTVNGKQFIAVSIGSTIRAFGLGE